MAIFETAPKPGIIVDSNGDELLIDANGALKSVIVDSNGDVMLVDVNGSAQMVLVGSESGLSSEVTHAGALLVAPPQSAQTAFGEAAVAELHPVLQVKFPYDTIQTQQIKSHANLGTVTAANAMLVCSTGAAANQSAAALTADTITYRPGQGVAARYTALFTAGVAGSFQAAGIGDSGEGFFFGYDGTAFGLMSRKGGRPEIRTLTITTKSTTAENITITLDGNAHATVAVTDATAGDLTTTANDIAGNDFSGIGGGWEAHAVGATVVFVSYPSAVQTGTYSLTAATTAIGTFAQTIAGTAPTDTWIPQASWNGREIFDGNGTTGVTLDPTKGNVFQIKFQYLGFGDVFFFVEDPNDGEIHLVHTIKYGNANTTPSLDNPSLPMCVAAYNVANTTDMVVKSASLAAFIEGIEILSGPRHGLKVAATLATANETPILSVRSNEVFDGTINRTKSKVLLAGFAADHTKSVAINVYANVTLTGATWTTPTATSPLQQDIAATAFTGGEYLFTVELGKDGRETIDFVEKHLEGVLVPGSSLTFTAEPISGTGADASMALYMVDLF